jgi:transposase
MEKRSEQHPAQRRYSPEVKERAVRMLAEHRHEYPSEWAAMTSIASKFGMTPETLRSWVRRSEIDRGVRLGLTTDERQRMRALERENRELRRANEILKAASVFFATELDGRTKK